MRQKHELAAVLGVAPDGLRVLSFDVGGNFGTRNRVYPEYGLVLWAARKLGRAGEIHRDALGMLLSDYQGRDLVTKVELALAQGRPFPRDARRPISAMSARAACRSSPLCKGAGLITGVLRHSGGIAARGRQSSPTPSPTQAYRSSGRPEVTFAIERLIDTAAAQLGIDRISLRRRNLVRPTPMPYRNAVGMTL